MENIDWSKAPKDATHYVMGDFTKWVGDVEFTWNRVCEHWIENGDPWSLDKYVEEKVHTIIERPNIEHYDAVNHPEHYQSEDGIECIDAIRASLGLDGFVAYCRGNAIKYSWRSGKKANHAEDLRKAAWYLEKAASELEK